MLRDSGNLDSVLYRILDGGQPLPRRFLIFDEKFQMTQVSSLDKNTIDEASMEITKLIAKQSATDARVKGLQQQISYLIERPYQQMRVKLRTVTENGEQDVQAGFCTLEQMEILQDFHYAEFRNFILERNPRYAARQVFMLGYPRLNPRDYLIAACAAYGPEQLASELEHIPREKLASKNLEILYSLPSMQRYMSHHLAARLEQEIYRCALRRPDFTGQVRIYLFCPPQDMLDILFVRIPGKAVFHDELPDCVAICKSTARHYEDDNTSFGRLALFLKSWDGSTIKVSVLRSQLDISPAVWNDLMADQRLKSLLEKYSVQRTGRGANAAWSIPAENCA